ncbi:lactose ABC transporter permease [Propionigenium maris DSM 9537]|uniref:Lactose ABC transporter permease n=1 Tax=Propionigenium maris DSM 9537 TaxID=1123000 RepID=A0A9W6LNU4_9FUSO|nr:sugar ABC transporter permease [Propionigenium maris]GLI56958.1 lactose ABC transporter permease [Propionigenium maris DSM 9537]
MESVLKREAKRTKKPFTLRLKMDKKTAPYYFIAPAVIMFSLFTIYPFLRTVMLSFYKFERGSYVFNGIQNYTRLFSDGVFYKALGNTFIYMGFQVPVMTGLSLILAVLLNSKLLKWKAEFRIAYFLPSVTEMVAYSIIFSLFLSDKGLLNYVLSLVGIKEIPWLIHPFWAKASIMLALTWRWTGYNMVIMLAGLQGIPNTLYEAAEIDGATKLQQFLYITIPQMKPIMLFSMLMSTIGTINLFSEPFILTKGGPSNSTISLGLYLYNQGFMNLNFGYASAISCILLILTAIMSFLQMKAGGEENGGI